MSAAAMRGLRQMRRRAEMTQQDFSERIGVTRATIIAWESGTSIPSPRQLTALAEMFGCTVGELFDPKEEDHDRPDDQG